MVFKFIREIRKPFKIIRLEGCSKIILLYWSTQLNRSIVLSSASWSMVISNFLMPSPETL